MGNIPERCSFSTTLPSLNASSPLTYALLPILSPSISSLFSSSMRSKVFGSLSSTVSLQCHHRLPFSRLPRFFSTSQCNSNDDPTVPQGSVPSSPLQSQRPQKLDDDPYSNDALSVIQRMLERKPAPDPSSPQGAPTEAFSRENELRELSEISRKEREAQEREAAEEPYHLHVVSTHHNTHITLTRQNHTPMFTFSCGTIGFKKAKRGEYDAAHQLAAYSLGKIVERGYLKDIRKLEVVLRGFGPGREATTKAIMGQEGRRIKDLIVRVTDSTRLKFGGTRSRKVRRL